MFYQLLFTIFSLATTSLSAAVPIHETIEKTMPKVVAIYVETLSDTEVNNTSGQPKTTKLSTGTGFFVNNQGLIITNAHVVNQAKNIVVKTYDGQEATANVIGLDHDSDIALINTPITNAPFITFEQLAEAKVGDTVYAIGNNFGLPHSLTKGIISATHRFNSQSKIEDFIQTDTAINMGNSGGPLINQHGDIIGINSINMSISGGNNGVAFAIPAYIARNISLQLAKFGNTNPGLMGIISQNISPNLAKALGHFPKKGVLVSEVLPDSAADKANIQAKDIITKVNDVNIDTSNQLRATIASLRAGTTLQITLYRQGKLMKVNAKTLDEKATHSDENKSVGLLHGVMLINHTELDSKGKKLTGIRVINIKETSKAWLAGLMPQDIITHINNQPIKDINKITSIPLPKDKPVLVTINRANQNLFIAISHPES